MTPAAPAPVSRTTTNNPQVGSLFLVGAAGLEGTKASAETMLAYMQAGVNLRPLEKCGTVREAITTIEEVLRKPLLPYEKVLWQATHAKAKQLDRMLKDLNEALSKPRSFDLKEYQARANEFQVVYITLSQDLTLLERLSPDNGGAYANELKQVRENFSWSALKVVASILFLTQRIIALFPFLDRVEANANEAGQDLPQLLPEQRSRLRQEVYVAAAILGEDFIKCHAIEQEQGRRYLQNTNTAQQDYLSDNKILQATLNEIEKEPTICGKIFSRIKIISQEPANVVNLGQRGSNSEQQYESERKLCAANQAEPLTKTNMSAEETLAKIKAQQQAIISATQGHGVLPAELRGKSKAAEPQRQGTGAEGVNPVVHATSTGQQGTASTSRTQTESAGGSSNAAPHKPLPTNATGQRAQEARFAFPTRPDLSGFKTQPPSAPESGEDADVDSDVGSNVDSDGEEILQRRYKNRSQQPQNTNNSAAQSTIKVSQPLVSPTAGAESPANPSISAADIADFQSSRRRHHTFPQDRYSAEIRNISPIDSIYEMSRSDSEKPATSSTNNKEKEQANNSFYKKSKDPKTTNTLGELNRELDERFKVYEARNNKQQAEIKGRERNIQQQAQLIQKKGSDLAKKAEEIGLL